MEKESPKQVTPSTKIIVSILLVIFLPILLIGAIFYIVWGVFLCLTIWLTWKKRRVLFVYSDSPTWKEYVEKEIVPYIKDRSVILNWSNRKSWKTSLATLAFKYFAGDRDFNPVAIVFHPFRRVKTYRFYAAFKDFKHGNPRSVEELKDKLFLDLEI